MGAGNRQDRKRQTNEQRERHCVTGHNCPAKAALHTAAFAHDWLELGMIADNVIDASGKDRSWFVVAEMHVALSSTGSRKAVSTTRCRMSRLGSSIVWP